MSDDDTTDVGQVVYTPTLSTSSRLPRRVSRKRVDLFRKRAISCHTPTE